nr:endo-1,4-beta-xylanase [Kineosporia corallincola]
MTPCRRTDHPSYFATSATSTRPVCTCASPRTTSPTTKEHTPPQAQQYADMLATCLDSPTCVSYTTWGVDDRYDCWTDDDGSVQQGHDLLFNERHPSPAHQAVK